MSLASLMERLGKISGERNVAGIMRWMGVSPSSYGNWRRRDTIPYKALVEVLLEKGISLDVFFSPQQPLAIPSELVLGEAQSYGKTDAAKADAIEATQQVTAFMARHKVEKTDGLVRFLVDLWLLDGGLWFSQPETQATLAKHLGADSDLL
ncbi:MAG: helix-turn-helix domain-containing protein [Idiomarina sp.]|nr:helix-turn-helix domain-containing protein [Idiomarina sp.]